ncbi:MAG: serine--tRNA ligase [Marine Group I thaumarchaeote]|nr:MAG: serine--tRNA ligase [Marine Group I thaumarchaeote]
MLDPKIILQNIEKVREMLANRDVDFDLDELVKLDKQRRDLIKKTDELRKKKNDISIEVAQKKKSEQDVTQIIKEMQEVSAKLSGLEETQTKVNESYTRFMFTLPNLIHDSVPIGKDETANKEIRRWGNVPQFDFDVKNHIDISQSLDLLDIERAAKIAGARFYYLKNDLVMLNQALIQYALDYLSEKKYTLVQPPYLINRKSMEGVIITEDFESVIYKIENDDLYLIGTSEHALAAMHADEILDGKKLPIRYAGISTCFRKEAGAHGKDQKGIFRVHQFDKIEQFAFSKPEDSWKEHERMLSIAEEFYQNLGIPYKVTILSSGDLGKISAKTYDLEVWMASQKAYREVVSCSNCLDFQSRRLKIRFRDKTSDQTQYIHTINSTLVATSRVIVSILENFQTKDGHVSIPKVLQKYVGKSLL